MNDSDFMYGCHSGVQKAIRRGDLDLMKTTFEAMWADQKHRNWLKWRALILVEEDVWWMLGEFAKFLDEVKGKKGKTEEKLWRRFLYQLAVCPKGKDAEALYWSTLGTRKRSVEHVEMAEMRKWIGVAGDEPEIAAEELYDQLKDMGKSEYELRAAKVTKGRMYQGGMVDDKWGCLAALVLIKTRGIDEKQVRVWMEEGTARHLEETKGRKPRTVNLPWYVMDMHTAIGKFALSVFMKNHGRKFHGMDRAKFDWIWFSLESAKIPKGQATYRGYSVNAELSGVENMWWPYSVKKAIVFGNLTAKEVSNLWTTKMRSALKGLVGWCTEKRAEK